jgi:hypothetical protein
MGIFQRLRAGLSFTEGPVTTLAVLSYLLVAAAVLYQDNLSAVPSARRQRGLNVSAAWADLHEVCGILSAHTAPR